MENKRSPLVWAFYHICRYTAHLPFSRLQPGEGRALGGMLFPQGPGLVEEVGKALCALPGLYADIPVDGAALLREHDDAHSCLILRDLFRDQARETGDTYLSELAGAIKTAWGVIDLLEAEARTLPAGQRKYRLRRLGGMGRAFVLVDCHRRSRRKNQGRKPGRPGPGAGKEQGAARVKQAGNRWQREFAEFLDQGGEPAPSPSAFTSILAPQDQMTEDSRALFIRAINHLCKYTARLPTVSLRPEERRALAAVLFLHGPGLVEEVGKALCALPELYADIPVDGAALLRKLDDAHSWLILRDLFRDLAREAGDTYLSKQAGAIKTAWGVIDLLEAEARTPLPAGGRRHRLRRLAGMGRAFVQVDYYRRMNPKARGTRSAGPAAGKKLGAKQIGELWQRRFAEFVRQYYGKGAWSRPDPTVLR